MHRIVTVEASQAAKLVELHGEVYPELDWVYSDHDPTPHDVVLAAEVDGVLVGYLVAGPPPGSDPRSEVVEIWEHGVVALHRHLGVGRALLAGLASRCEPSVRLHLDPTNQLDPERIDDYYRACGFARPGPDGHLQATAGEVRAATAAAAASWLD